MGLHGVTSVKENRTGSAQEQRLEVSQAAAGHKPSAAASFPEKARHKRRVPCAGSPRTPRGQENGQPERRGVRGCRLLVPRELRVG